MLGANDFRTKELFEKYCMFQSNERDAELAAQIASVAAISGLPIKGFMKADDGKNMLSLIEPQFIQSLGEVLTFGAKKYAKNNWQLCEDTSRYKDALLRHIYAYLSGEKVDQESGLSHLSHAAFGLMCLQYFDNLKEQK